MAFIFSGGIMGARSQTVVRGPVSAWGSFEIAAGFRGTRTDFFVGNNGAIENWISRGCAVNEPFCRIQFLLHEFLASW